MIILGVECTAHTFGVGIITSEGKALANAKDSYTSETGGMILNEVAEHHVKAAEEMLKKAFSEAALSWDNVDLVSYSAGPGMDPALWAGYKIAKKWALEKGKKLIGVNHCAAHLSIGVVWNKLIDPCYLYVSGVNTQIIVKENKKYIVIGETQNIGLGNLLDKFGRVLGLGFPAGPKIEELAKRGRYRVLPYSVKGMDVSFSGILTKVEQLYKQGKVSKEDLCFSLQETCFAMCTEVVERALAHIGKKELLLVGGVGANKRFCKMLEIMCRERGAVFYKVPIDLAGDQGVMIAWEGYLRKEESGDIEVKPHWRVDEV